MSKTFKIGELAKATGLTVRALHHYDQIGLLVPSERSESDYRLYDQTDVVRLQQILSLKELGFPLEQIKKLLDEAQYSQRQIIEMHLAQMTQELKQRTRVRDQLQELSNVLANQESISVERLIKIIEVINMKHEHNFDPKFTAEEEATLAARRDELGEDVIAQGENEWPALIASVRAHMEAGTPPNDPEVQKLAARWNELVEMFTGGDQQIAQKVKTAYDNSPGFAAEMGLDAELFQYVSQIQANLD